MSYFRQLSVIVLFFFLPQLAFSSSMCPKHQSISLLKFKEMLTPKVGSFPDRIGSPPKVGSSFPPKVGSFPYRIGSFPHSFPPKVGSFPRKVTFSPSQVVPSPPKVGSFSRKVTFSPSQVVPSPPKVGSSHPWDRKSKYQNCYPKMSRWNMSKDCCLWDGVICDELSGLVIELDLSCSYLVGTIHSNSTLFELSHLQRLDLSSNYFLNSKISPKFGLFSSLTHLDLSFSQLSGQIPSEISQLSRLQSLIFSQSSIDEVRLAAHDFKMLLRNLTQLRELDLMRVNIYSTIPHNFSSHITSLLLETTGLYGKLPDHIFHLQNLKELHLSYNDQLTGYFPETKWNSSASLTDLDLNGVNFTSNLPESLGYLTSLYNLGLQSCNLWGSIPESLSNLTSIEVLQLALNSLDGGIPSRIFSLPSLVELDLSSNNFSGQLGDFKSNSLVFIDVSKNQLQGHFPISIRNSLNLKFLDLSFNNFSGHVDISTFSNLKQLYFLSLSKNRISLTSEHGDKFTLPESLEQLGFAGCDVKNSEFLRSAKHLLDMDLSNNMLTSVDLTPLQSLYSIDLRSNLLQGSLPTLPTSTLYFFVSHNNLTGEIPLSICKVTSLSLLDLARNNLRGDIPQCLGNMTRLEVLDMHQNNLSGTLPDTFSIWLRSLNLHGNDLVGEIPRSLINCRMLQVVDLGGNHLNDTFPMWLGTLPVLQVLSLRSNKLHGSIKTSRRTRMFPELRILDLSCNSFTESLPTSLFQQFKAMRTIDQTMTTPSYLGTRYYQDSVTVATKGRELELVRILTVYTAIDLSSNRFEGHIPSILGDLTALHILNLSHNGFQGQIPPSLGNLSSVESLDLSANQLSGGIPGKLASLDFLAVLNLSHNHLQGCIPKGPQFATFENNSYEGNDGLRGFPVSEGCGNTELLEKNSTASALDDQETNSQFLIEFLKAALVGYGTGLCIGLSIVYFTISTGYPIWLSRIIQKLEHKIVTGWRKKQQRQRNYRGRRNRS